MEEILRAIAIGALVIIGIVLTAFVITKFHEEITKND